MEIPPGSMVLASPDMSPAALPPDILAFERDLQEVKAKAGKIRFWMDGAIFKVVGLETVVGFIPGVSDVLSIGATTWLVRLAVKARMPAKQRYILIFTGVVDTALGGLPLAGDFLDVFFRSHAWGAQRVQRHVDAQLADVEALREHLAQHDTLPDDHEALLRLREVLAG